MSNSYDQHIRPQARELTRRLKEPRRFIQVVAGARQVGKTTLARQVAARVGLPARYASADEPALRGGGWVEQQWVAARILAAESGRKGALLPHWSFSEMRAAFGCSLNEYLYYGAYPGAAPLIKQPARWRRYILDSLIETTLSRDVLLLSRVDKPALLRRVLEIGCAHAGQILSYNKMVGQLQDAGNTTTLAHYLDLLAGAGLVTGLQKYAGKTMRRRASSPKLQVLNTALLTAQSEFSLAEARKDHAFWGRLTEVAVGAHLANAAAAGDCALYYWRERSREVDFVVRAGRRLTAIEVKSARARRYQAGMTAFSDAFGDARKLLVGGDGIDVEAFLSKPALHWLSR